MRIVPPGTGRGTALAVPQALDVLRKLRDAGVDQPIFNMPFVENPATLEYVAEKVIAPVANW